MADINTNWWVIGNEEHGFISYQSGYMIRPLKEAAIYRSRKAAERKRDALQPDYDSDFELRVFEVTATMSL